MVHFSISMKHKPLVEFHIEDVAVSVPALGARPMVVEFAFLGAYTLAPLLAHTLISLATVGACARDDLTLPVVRRPSPLRSIEHRPRCIGLLALSVLPTHTC